MFCILTGLNAQHTMSHASDLPYREIPEYPAAYTPGNVAARMIDGLGYRYYWATEELTDEDLDFKTSEDSRSSRETLDHIHSLSQTILNAVTQMPNIRPAPSRPELSFEEMRKQTLDNFERASSLLKAIEGNDLEPYKIVFKRGEDSAELPFWNLLNGPIADAIYHVGQVVSFRRASGNPMDPRVNVLLGKTRE